MIDHKTKNRYILQLRYNSNSPSDTTKVYFSTVKIHQLLQIPLADVNYVIEYYEKHDAPPEQPRQVKRRNETLTDEMVQFLVKKEQLEKQFFLPLKARKTLFERQFPDRKIRASHI